MKKSEVLLEWLSRNMPLSQRKAMAGALKKELAGNRTVLDVGCGCGSYSEYRDYLSVGIELYDQDAEKAKRSGNYVAVMRGDVRRLCSLGLADKSYDVVTCNEVIEHLEKEDGVALINEMERIARCKVIVMTPWGLYLLPGTRTNPYMQHKSGWLPEEFQKRGYRTRGLSSLRWKRSGGFFMVVIDYFASIVMRPLIKWKPSKFCNDFCAVKEIDG